MWYTVLGDTMLYKAVDIAEYVISIAHEMGDDITQLKLQKLLYYVQGYHLALKDAPLYDEELLAWKHGPVIYSVRKVYAQYKDNPLPQVEVHSSMDEFDKQFIREIYNKFRKYSAGELVRMTHKEKPWKEATKSDVITEESVKSFFKEQLSGKEWYDDIPVVDELPNDMYDPEEDEYWEIKQHREVQHLVCRHQIRGCRRQQSKTGSNSGQ
jgi:uncharacterized phage-associated protein